MAVKLSQIIGEVRTPPEPERIARETPGAYFINQFGNPDNPLAHETGTTAPARAIDISVEYLRPARRENLFARARIRRLGRRVATIHAEAWQQDEDKPVCLLQSHLRLPSIGSR